MKVLPVSLFLASLADLLRIVPLLGPSVIVLTSPFTIGTLGMTDAEVVCFAIGTAMAWMAFQPYIIEAWIGMGRRYLRGADCGIVNDLAGRPSFVGHLARQERQIRERPVRHRQRFTTHADADLA